MELQLVNLDVRRPGLERPALLIDRLAAPDGAQIAVTGVSGSGKTTLLNMLSGLETVGGGAVFWSGVDLGAFPEMARDSWRADNVGLVVQEFHLFPGLSALENVLLPQRFQRFRLEGAIIDRARSLLSRVGIDRPGQKAGTLSRGQMQRTAIARALLGAPKILLADEPTASLDAKAALAVADLLCDLSAENGSTLIVASHDPQFSARLPIWWDLDQGLVSVKKQGGAS